MEQITNESNEITCVIPHNVFWAGENLCSENIYANTFNLNSLSLLVEAIVLYDKIIIYDYLPSADLRSNYLQDIVRTPFGKKLREEKILKVINPYKYITNQGGEYELFLEVMTQKMITEAFHFNKGISAIYTMLPPDILNFDGNSYIESPDFNTFKKAFSIGHSEQIFSYLNRNKLKEFIKPWTINKFWQVEMGNLIREKERAIGLFISPECAPLWIKEKECYFSKLHNKYKDFEKVMYRSKFKNEFIVDFSPLTVVALDCAPSREQLLETMLLMRRDYQELREIGRKYQTQLEKAETYLEIEEVINSWEKSWELVLNKITKVDQPLRRRLFGWDIYKSVSWKRIAAGILHEIGTELYKNTIMKKLSVLFFLEKEFLSSRKIDLRIKELFGGISDNMEISEINNGELD